MDAEFEVSAPKSGRAKGLAQILDAEFEVKLYGAGRDLQAGPWSVAAFWSRRVSDLLQPPPTTAGGCRTYF
eukprot:517016-Prorocentrum_minimum.AAC.1